MRDEGFAFVYLPTASLGEANLPSGDVVGLLVLISDVLRTAHIVVVDEVGIVDPASGFPAHVGFDAYWKLQTRVGFKRDSEYLALTLCGQTPRA